MNQAAETLVVINSIVLILFLIIAVAALVQIIMLLRHIRNLIEKAEDVADAVESASKAFQNAAMPFGIARFVTSIVQPFIKEAKKGKNNMGKSKNFAIGAIVAAAAGYVTGILTAPKSGKETRQDIKDVAEETVVEVETKLKKVHTELHGVIEKTKQQANNLTGKARQEVDSASSLAEQAKEKVRLALSSIHEGESSDKDLQKALKEAEKSINHLKKIYPKIMPFGPFKKQDDEQKPTTRKDYEKLGKEIVSLYDAVHPKPGVIYRIAFIKGIFTGVGGVIGATLVIALLLWTLSLFSELPFIGNFTDSIQNTIDQTN